MQPGDNRIRTVRIGLGSTVTAGLLACAVLLLAQNDTEQGGSISAAILRAARLEAEKRSAYIEQYRVLKYPGGDVPAGTGVCTDLVIRACRAAGVDLQKELHEDRAAHPEAYPVHIWENKQADKNIDHRRCQNLCVWFKRFARSLPVLTDRQSIEADWRPGDIVFFVRPRQSQPWHVAVVSDRKDADGMPLIIEGYPPWATESRRLDHWAPIHSHFRLTRIP
jgi:uncharacterized protein YijF (DUF1287 family)